MITQVKIRINGSEYNAAFNPDSGLWEYTGAAPDTTSFPQPGGYYPVQVSALNDSGQSKTVTSGSPGIGNSLKLFVTETEKPVISITVPGNGGYVNSATPIISFLALDDEQGSGINTDSFVITIDGNTVSATVTAAGEGYTVTLPAMADGSHTLSISVSDNDGNQSDAASISLVVDTTAPVITITSPTDGQVTRKLTGIFMGSVTDANPDMIATYSNNGSNLGELMLTQDGAFEIEIDLSVGDNVLTINAVDKAGNQSSASSTFNRNFDFWVIIDRTLQDVIYARQTPGVYSLKGHYGATDLNRVEGDVYFLTELLKEYGETITVTTKTNWTTADEPHPADMERYLENIQTIYENFYIYVNMPFPPETMQNLDYIYANNIEKILLYAYEQIIKPSAAFIYYSGQIYSGQI
jgi:hypothetical protein